MFPAARYNKKRRIERRRVYVQRCKSIPCRPGGSRRERKVEPVTALCPCSEVTTIKDCEGGGRGITNLSALLHPIAGSFREPTALQPATGSNVSVSAEKRPRERLCLSEQNAATPRLYKEFAGFCESEERKYG